MKFALSLGLVILSALTHFAQAQDAPAAPAASAALAPAAPIKWDCVKNSTNKILHVSITTNTGTIHSFPKPGQEVRFAYNNWNAKAVVVAYEYGKDNLFAAFEFQLMDQSGNPHPSCILIEGTIPFGSGLGRQVHAPSPGAPAAPEVIAPIVP